MPSPYLIPANTHQTTTEIKKSRFIARVACVADREAAMAFLQQARDDYPDARHHCWAYLLGNPAAASSAAMNDAGEPSGTAGKPIFNVINHKGVGDTMVVVIRYFGGIKLGAGGLVRAYSEATESVLSSVELVEKRTLVSVTLECGFSQEQGIRHWVEQQGAQVIGVDYGEQVSIELAIAEESRADLTAYCSAVGILPKFQSGLD